MNIPAGLNIHVKLHSYSKPTRTIIRGLSLKPKKSKQKERTKLWWLENRWTYSDSRKWK